jgi:Flp pilus assembly pilin Flp
MLELLKSLHKEDAAQDIIEYIFIASLISVAAVAIVPGIVPKVSGYWASLSTALT